MRARTKGYIEKLEAELNDLRNILCHDNVFEALWSQNKALVEEMGSLRACIRARSIDTHHACRQDARCDETKLYDRFDLALSTHLAGANIDLAPGSHIISSATSWHDTTPGLQSARETMPPITDLDYLFPPCVEEDYQQSVITDDGSSICDTHIVSETTEALNNIGNGIYSHY